MSKSAKKRSAGSTESAAGATKPAHTEPGHVNGNVSLHAQQSTILRKSAGTVSKQSRVIAMLQSPAGTTIAAMMQATGWQQHSVRGFLAGVVRKRLKLKLSSKKVDGTRVYRICIKGSHARVDEIGSRLPYFHRLLHRGVPTGR